MDSSYILSRQTRVKDTPLHPHFQPGPYDVICSRGKAAYNHTGNIHFRSLIADHLEGYKACTTKVHKTMAVMAIIDQIRERSPDGGFVSFCNSKNCYVEVGDRKAREKVGHALRDLIKSSTTSKRISTWKDCTTKTNVKEDGDDEPALQLKPDAASSSRRLSLKTAPRRLSSSVMFMFAGAYNLCRRASSVVLSADHIKDLLSADDILMESHEFNAVLEDSGESYADIFDDL